MDLDKVTERDNMLENLLVILNSAAAIGVGPSPGDFLAEEEMKYRTKSGSTIPGSRRSLRTG